MRKLHFDEALEAAAQAVQLMDPSALSLLPEPTFPDGIASELQLTLTRLLPLPDEPVSTEPALYDGEIRQAIDNLSVRGPYKEAKDSLEKSVKPLHLTWEQNDLDTRAALESAPDLPDPPDETRHLKGEEMDKPWTMESLYGNGDVDQVMKPPILLDWLMRGDVNDAANYEAGAERLLAQGADLTARDVAGRSFLHIAAHRRRRGATSADTSRDPGWTSMTGTKLG